MKVMNARNIVILPVCLLIVFTAGCTRLAVKASGPWVSQLIDEIQDTKSARTVKEGIASQVLLITAITEMAPDNLRLLKECSFLYCSYGLFVEDDDPEFAKELYTIGREYGMRALKQDSAFRKGLESGQQVSELVGKLGKKYAPALCWASLNGGFYLILNLEDPSALMEMGDVAAMAKRSVELDGNYFHGAGKLFIAAYYAMVPEFLGLGGGPESSKKMFEEARAVTDGKFLLVDLFEARFLAPVIDDKALFKERLKHVLAADAGALEGAQLLNELAKVKAGIYLKKQNTFF